nr:hypothetical protein [Tanacetum cinerariifolium]
PQSSTADFGPEPPWIVGEPISEKKSVFLARVAPVSSPQQAKQYVQHLLATDKKAAKATHNMTSWRIKGPNDTVFQDCDDDGETAAGSRMLHLMQPRTTKTSRVRRRARNRWIKRMPPRRTSDWCSQKEAAQRMMLERGWICKICNCSRYGPGRGATLLDIRAKSNQTKKLCGTDSTRR